MDMSSDMWSEFRSANGQVIGQLHGENESLKQDLYGLRQDLDAVNAKVAQNANLLLERDILKVERDNAKLEQDNLKTERDQLKVRIDEVSKDNQALTGQFENKRKELNDLRNRIDQYSASAAYALAQKDEMKDRLDRQLHISQSLKAEILDCRKEKEQLLARLRSLIGDFEPVYTAVKRKAETAGTSGVVIKSPRYDDISDDEQNNRQEDEYQQYDDDNDWYNDDQEDDYVERGHEESDIKYIRTDVPSKRGENTPEH